MWDDKSVKWKLLSRVRLFVTPMDYSPPGSSVHGILQARILEWIAILFSRESPQPRDATQVSFIAGRFFTNWATRCITYLALMCICVSNYHLVYFKCIQSRVCVCVCAHAQALLTCCVRLFAIPWTVAHQAPLSTEFSRQEYWSGLPFPPATDLPDPGIKPGSPELQANSSLTEPAGKLCSVLSNSLRLMDCRLPGSSVLGIFQARILECVAISFSSIQLYLSIIPQ